MGSQESKQFFSTFDRSFPVGDWVSHTQHVYLQRKFITRLLQASHPGCDALPLELGGLGNVCRGMTRSRRISMG